ncbi:MAG: hypothetical protein ACOVQP_01925 [Candidatus Fonsibacter ubiquis]|jgi:hypothetical protein
MHKLSQTASNVQVKLNQIRFSWPKISTVIYPKQTLRINTGWQTASMPSDLTVTSVPHKSLIDNNLIAVPQIIDQSN